MSAENLDRDERENMKLRLDASVIGLKLSGDFTERQSVSVDANVNVVNAVISLNQVIDELRTKPEGTDGNTTSS